MPATATLDEAAGIAAGLPAAVAEGQGPVVVDAAALSTFDTSAIALVLQARRLAQAAGRGFQLESAPPKLLELARLYGVAELLSAGAAESESGPSAAT